MNKNLFRLRFSAHSHQLVPVSETCTSQCNAQKRTRQRQAGMTGPGLKLLTRCLLVTWLSQDALAGDIVPNGGALTIGQSGKNIPLINIEAANAQGLSHNRFKEFHVSERGVILNNSAHHGGSRIGGEVRRNPNLRPGQEASTILAEVNSTSAPSRLAGPLEVFGKRANVIIANPNGITVDGLHTINTQALTLTTGSADPQRAARDYAVKSGNITFGEKGINTSGLEMFDVIARAININGPIAGGADTTISLSTPSMEGAPRTAISGSELGVMHGRHITISVKALEQSAHLPGHIRAADDIHISATGDITLGSANSQIHAGGKLSVHAQRTLSIEGGMHANQLVASAYNVVVNTSSIEVRGKNITGSSADIKAANLVSLSPKLEDSTTAVKLLLRGGNANIVAHLFANKGDIAVLDGSANITTNGYQNAGSIFGKSAQLTVGSRLTFDASNRAPNVQTKLAIRAPSLQLENGAKVSAPDSLKLEAYSSTLTSRNSSILSGGSLELSAAQDLVNDAGSLIWSKADASINADLIANGTHAIIHSGGAMHLKAQRQLLNTGGRIQSDGAMTIRTNLISNLSAPIKPSALQWMPGQHVLFTDAVGQQQITAAKQQMVKWPRDANVRVLGIEERQVEAPRTPAQAIMHSGGNLLIQPYKQSTGSVVVENRGSITSAGKMEIDGRAINRSHFTSLSYEQFLRQASEPKIEVYTKSTRPFSTYLHKDPTTTVQFHSLLDMLDYAFVGKILDPQSPAYSRPMADPLAETSKILQAILKTGDYRATPRLATILTDGLGTDWKFLDTYDIAKKWSNFRSHTNKHQLRFYADTPTVLAAKEGVFATAGLSNGDSTAIENDRKIFSNELQTTLLQTLNRHAENVTRIGQQGTRALMPDVPDAPQVVARTVMNPASTPSRPANDLLLILHEVLENPFLFSHNEETVDTNHPYYQSIVSFIDHKRYANSTAFFEKIGYRKPEDAQLGGDAHFDDELITRQVEHLLGAQLERESFAGTSMVKQLMDNAYEAQASLNLQPGQKLTREQTDKLEHDIVWYTVERSGDKKLLLPRVYLSRRSHDAAQAIRDSGGAVVVSAGDVKVAGPAGIKQNNGLIIGRRIALDAGTEANVEIGHGGGLVADSSIKVQGKDVSILGGTTIGKDVTLSATHDVNIGTDMQEGDASRTADPASGIDADQKLDISAGSTIHTKGSHLHGDTVSLHAEALDLGTVTESSSGAYDSSLVGLILPGEYTGREKRDQEIGTAISGEHLDLGISSNVDMTGGKLDFDTVEGHVGGAFTIHAATQHSVADAEHTGHELFLNTTAGAAGKVWQHDSASGVQTHAGKQAGFKLELGTGVNHSQSHDKSVSHQNAELDLREGRLEIGGTLDVGGADIHANSQAGEDAQAPVLQIEAADVISSKVQDSHEQTSSGWSLVLGSKSTVSSTVLDVSDDVGTLGTQAGEGRTVNPVGATVQTASDINKLVFDDTVHAQTGIGVDFHVFDASKVESSDHTNILGGSIKLKSTHGDIHLVGTDFDGGKTLVMDSAKAIKLEAGKFSSTSSQHDSGISFYANATAGCNAVQAACATGVNTTLGISQSNHTSTESGYQQSNVHAEIVQMIAKDNIVLDGTQISADQHADVKAGKDLDIISRQTVSDSESTDFSIDTKVGAAVNNHTGVSPDGSIGVIVRHESETQTSTSATAGISSGSTVNMQIEGDAQMTGGTITADGSGSSVHVAGKTETHDLLDLHEHRGGYGGLSTQINGTTSETSSSVEGGTIAGESSQSRVHSTIDIGQEQGHGAVESVHGVDGELTQDRTQSHSIDHEQKWAQTDARFSTPQADADQSEASRKQTSPAKPQYGKRIVMVVGDHPDAMAAGERLAAKHAEHTELVHVIADDVHVLKNAQQSREGPLKIQIVGHGSPDEGNGSVGGKNAAQLAQVIRRMQEQHPAKVVLVSCDSGSCPGNNIRTQMQAELEADGHGVKGYDGAVDVSVEGRKIKVLTGGLGPKRPPGEKPKTEPEAPGQEPPAAAPPRLVWGRLWSSPDGSTASGATGQASASTSSAAATSAPHRASARASLDIPTAERSHEAVSAVRRSLNVEATRNIAVAKYNIDGQSGDLTGISGMRKLPTTVDTVRNPTFEPIATGQNPRIHDSEFKIFEHLSSKLNSYSSGTVHIYTERPMCISCASVAKQFAQRHPNIHLVITDGRGQRHDYNAVDAHGRRHSYTGAGRQGH